MSWYSIPIDELYKVTDSNNLGLSSFEASNKLKINGLNELKEKEKKSPLKIFINQFKDFMILLLIIAGIISGIVGDITDTVIILIIVLLNAVLGFIQEYKAEKAIYALKKLSALECNVLRDKKINRIPAVELVVGDIVFLEAGNTIPADMRIIEDHSLKVNESALTGESIEINKVSFKLTEENLPIGDQLNMLFKGTIINNGRAKALVVATGMNTEIGKIANLLQENELQTPLQKKLEDFGKKLSYIVLGICLILFFIELMKGEKIIDMLLLSISLAVAGIPEALPALTTIALALGAKKLATENALIRKLPAVETLGSVNYICSDKTGTLTQNKMKVIEVYEKNKNKFFIKNISPLDLTLMLNHEVKNIEGKLFGDSTEIALLEYVKEKYDTNIINETFLNLPRVNELPFDSIRKCMTSIHKFEDKFLILSKGAPETIFNNLSIEEKNSNILSTNNAWSEKGLRVLGFSYKIIHELPEVVSYASIEKDLNFIGLIGCIDPPREEVKASISECKNAGIIPVMITGDHPKTAQYIAKEIGILSENDLTVTGQELHLMTSEELENKIEKIKVYARVSPEQKLSIIKALQKKNHFVAMTGDGVNDAPSLKAANIGIAMGINGTDVSKEAAHMILLDDNFVTIVKAIKEGRRIYENIRKFVKYIMTTNSAEILTITLAPLIGLPIPLLPVQILWINLITDSLPSLALASEKAEKDLMKRPPRKTNESLFSGGIGFHIVWVSILMTAITLGVEMWAVKNNNLHWQSMIFTMMALLQLAHVFAIRSERTFLYKQGLLTNMPLFITILITFLLQIIVIHSPIGNNVLKTSPLNISEWIICISLSIVFFHFIEFEKWIKQKVLRKP